MSRFVTPVTLIGPRWVQVEPLSTDHIRELAEAARDSENASLWFTNAPSPDEASNWVRRMLDMQEGGPTCNTDWDATTDGTAVRGPKRRTRRHRPTGNRHRW